MAKGWKLESARHSLAAKGIETTKGTANIEKLKKSLFPLPYKILKETCPKNATPEYRKLWSNLIKGLTDEEFELWRYNIYLTPSYTVSFKESSDDRTRKQWAKDKAYDDVLNKAEVIESILEE